MVLAELIPRYSLHIKTKIPAGFFNLYLEGPFDITPGPVDAGCAQKDAIEIDPVQSFKNLERFYSNYNERFQKETQWLEEKKIDLIISDTASLPLKAGKTLSIPSVLLSNFTWLDIYSGFPGAESCRSLLNRLEEEYSQATLHILPQLHLINDVIPEKKEVGLLALRGRNIFERLKHELGPSLKNKTLVFIYLGEAGQAGVAWENLPEISDCVFLSRDPLPTQIPNLIILDQTYYYPDLIASSDLVCTKGGYSTFASAFSHEKPVLTCSRKNFCEYKAMEDFLTRHRVGHIMESGSFLSGRWGNDIKKALDCTVKGKVRLNGEKEVLSILEQILLN